MRFIYIQAYVNNHEFLFNAHSYLSLRLFREIFLPDTLRQKKWFFIWFHRGNEKFYLNRSKFGLQTLPNVLLGLPLILDTSLLDQYYICF